MKIFWIFLLSIAAIIHAEVFSDTAENDFSSIYVVNDSDGFVNVRSSPSTKSDIVGCIKSGTPIYSDDIFFNKDGWCNIHHHQSLYQKSCADSSKYFMEAAYSDSDKINVYIHESRLLQLSRIDTIRRTSFTRSRNTSIAKFADFELRLTIKKFNSKQRKVTHGKFGETYVDGKYAWGTDASIPTYETQLFEIFHSNIQIDVDKQYFNNLFDLRLNGAIIFSARNHYNYVVLQGSDGAGGYCVVLTIFKNRIINISPRLSVFA